MMMKRLVLFVSLFLVLSLPAVVNAGHGVCFPSAIAGKEVNVVLESRYRGSDVVLGVVEEYIRKHGARPVVAMPRRGRHPPPPTFRGITLFVSLSHENRLVVVNLRVVDNETSESLANGSGLAYYETYHYRSGYLFSFHFHYNMGYHVYPSRTEALYGATLQALESLC